MGAWDLWNLAIIPSLLNNCGIWTEISEETVNKLDDIQNAYVRRVLHVPLSTPKASLRSETGLLSMRHRIWAEKVKMVMALKDMDDDFLAKKVYEEQIKQGWKGLAEEVTNICSELGIADANLVKVSKGQVNMAVREHHKEELKKEMKKKIEDLVDDETGYVKEYMLVNNIEQSRMLFRIRTKMLELKVIMKGKYENNLVAKHALAVSWNLNHMFLTAQHMKS